MTPRHFDNSSDESFGGFDEDELASLGEEEAAKGRRDATLLDLDDEKDSDEEELERFVLGSKASFREQLFRGDFDTDSAALVVASGQDVAEHGQAAISQAHLNDSALFFIDTAPGDKPLSLAQDHATKLKSDPEAPAWEDSDDERLAVSLAGATRLRKLRASAAEDVVSGTEYSRRLRQQYLRLYPQPAWARDAAAGSKDGSRRRRSSATSRGKDGDESSASENSDDDDFDSTLPLETFLRNAHSFTGGTSGANKRRKLRPETIDIQRTRDIPDSHKAAVSSLSFHPKHPILMSSCTSSIMYLHQIDPAAYPIPNPALTSVQVKSTDLRRSAFLGPDGDEVVFAGRRRYFHTWNLSSGQVKKVTKIQGHQQEQRTMERFQLSPSGRYMALAASDKKGGGMLNIINVATMQWITQARVDGRGGIADFAWWSTSNGLAIASKDGQVAEWSMLSRRTVGIWRDEGSIGATVLALGGRSGGPSDLGDDRWVAVGSNSGILNIYDRNELIARSSKENGGVTEIKALPQPTRTFEQLTTAITTVTFTPDGQLMAFSSRLKKDALRLVHLPSCTVYRNWPTEQTPLGRVTAVAFSAQSDVLAVGNDSGKIRLWELRD